MRLNLDMSVGDAVVAMSNKVPGALHVIGQLYERFGDQATHLLLMLDQAGIYGPDIWICFKDICKQNLEMFRDEVFAQRMREALDNYNNTERRIQVDEDGTLHDITE